MSPATVGYTTGHGEAIDLRREAHEDIEAILRDERLGVLEVPDALDDAKLGLVSALILGAPAHPLSAAEFAALGRFVASGGRLLAIPHPMLADWRPRAARRKRLLSRFLPRADGVSSFLAGLSYSIVRPDGPPSRSPAPLHETTESYRESASPGDLLYRIDGAGDGPGRGEPEPPAVRRVRSRRGRPVRHAGSIHRTRAPRPARHLAAGLLRQRGGPSDARAAAAPAAPRLPHAGPDGAGRRSPSGTARLPRLGARPGTLVAGRCPAAPVLQPGGQEVRARRGRSQASPPALDAPTESRCEAIPSGASCPERIPQLQGCVHRNEPARGGA